MHAPVREQVPLNSKSLYKNFARASGGANNMHPLSGGGGGGTNGKDPNQNVNSNKTIPLKKIQLPNETG